MNLNMKIACRRISYASLAYRDPVTHIVGDVQEGYGKITGITIYPGNVPHFSIETSDGDTNHVVGAPYAAIPIRQAKLVDRKSGGEV